MPGVPRSLKASRTDYVPNYGIDPVAARWQREGARSVAGNGAWPDADDAPNSGV